MNLRNRWILPVLGILILGEASFSALGKPLGLKISAREGIRTEGWSGKIKVVTLSGRTVALSIVPDDMTVLDLVVTAEGLDPGDYFLAVSGSDPRLVSSDELGKGVRVTLPAVVGRRAAQVHDFARTWAQRVEEAASVARDHGYTEDQIPLEFIEIRDRILKAGEGLEEAAASSAAVLRITPADAGPVPLSPLAPMSAEEVSSREQALRESTKELIRRVGEVEEIVREPVLEVLVPIRLGDPGGRAVELALTGRSGTGELEFSVENPTANPPVTVELEVQSPPGWVPRGKNGFRIQLDPGESEKIVCSFEIEGSTRGRRVAVPIEMRIQGGQTAFTHRTGVGFGHDFIRTWNVVGPFPNPKNQAIDTVYPPEEEIDLSATYEGLEGPVRWKELTASANGYLDLKKALHPNTNSVAYATVWIYVPRFQQVICAAGSNDGMKAWMNGNVIHSHPGERGAAPEQDLFPAKMKRGWNRLLVKVLQTGGGWGLYFEIRDRTGGTPPGMKISTSKPD